MLLYFSHLSCELVGAEKGLGRVVLGLIGNNNSPFITLIPLVFLLILMPDYATETRNKASQREK